MDSAHSSNISMEIYVPYICQNFVAYRVAQRRPAFRDEILATKTHLNFSVLHEIYSKIVHRHLRRSVTVPAPTCIFGTLTLFASILAAANAQIFSLR